MNKKEMLSIEIARRKIKKEMHDYILEKCMNQTVKYAYDFILHDKKLAELHDKKLLLEVRLMERKPLKNDVEISDEGWKAFKDIMILSELTDVFKGWRVEQNAYNCQHSGFNCDYILTEEDLIPGWQPPTPKL